MRAAISSLDIVLFNFNVVEQLDKLIPGLRENFFKKMIPLILWNGRVLDSIDAEFLQVHEVELPCQSNINKVKSKFTQIIMVDKGKWTDAYWQASNEVSNERSLISNKTWMFRAKAETEHGGGDKGAKAVDDAVAAGVYQQKSYSVGSMSPESQSRYR